MTLFTLLHRSEYILGGSRTRKSTSNLYLCVN